MNYLLNRANEIRKKEGYLKLLKKILLELLPKVPIRKIVKFNEVLVLIEKRVNLYSALTKSEKLIKDNPNAQGGMILAHKKLTRPDDTVVIVGGGNGITSVIAANIVGKTGKVIVYEGGVKMVKNISLTLELNGVTNSVQIYHAIVGSKISIYGKTANAKIISAKDLPGCDVLELDCEGSEVGILKNMTISPRVIIVEIHPWLFSEKPDWVTDYLRYLGYRIVFRGGHDGIEINQNDFKELLYRSKSHIKETKYLKSGARWPVIAAGIKS